MFILYFYLFIFYFYSVLCSAASCWFCFCCSNFQCFFSLLTFVCVIWWYICFAKLLQIHSTDILELTCILSTLSLNTFRRISCMNSILDKNLKFIFHSSHCHYLFSIIIFFVRISREIFFLLIFKRVFWINLNRWSSITCMAR